MIGNRINQGILFLFFVMLFCECRESIESDRPNIVFILAENPCVTGLKGETSSRRISTPALDALARQSLVFDYAYMYSTGAQSRMAILTGQQSFHEDESKSENIFSRWGVKKNVPNYAELLVEAGYNPIFLGNWNIGRSDSYKGQQVMVPVKNKFTIPHKSKEWLTDELTDEAIMFMDKHKEELFCINLLFSEIPDLKEMQGDSILDQAIEEPQKRTEFYPNEKEILDDNIQRIVDYLGKSNLRKKTIILFCAENRLYSLSENHPLRGSNESVYNTGTQMSTFINWPGKVNVRRSYVAISELDFYPTFLSLAGIDDCNKQLEGNSLTELFISDSDLFRKRTLIRKR